MSSTAGLNFYKTFYFWAIASCAGSVSFDTVSNSAQQPLSWKNRCFRDAWSWSLTQWEPSNQQFLWDICAMASGSSLSSFFFASSWTDCTHFRCGSTHPQRCPKNTLLFGTLCLVLLRGFSKVWDNLGMLCIYKILLAHYQPEVSQSAQRAYQLPSTNPLALISALGWTCEKSILHVSGKSCSWALGG